MKYEKRPLEKEGRFLIDGRHPWENRTALLRSVESILSTAWCPLERKRCTTLRRQVATTLGAKLRRPSHRRCVQCLKSIFLLTVSGQPRPLSPRHFDRREAEPRNLPTLNYCHRWSIRSKAHCQSEVRLSDVSTIPLWYCVPPFRPQFGGAAKGKRLNGQARRLTSPHLEVLCRTSTVAQ